MQSWWLQCADLPCDASAKAASLSGKHCAHMCCEQNGLDAAMLTRSCRRILCICELPANTRWHYSNECPVLLRAALTSRKSVIQHAKALVPSCTPWYLSVRSKAMFSTPACRSETQAASPAAQRFLVNCSIHMSASWYRGFCMSDVQIWLMRLKAGGKSAVALWSTRNCLPFCVLLCCSSFDARSSLFMSSSSAMVFKTCCKPCEHFYGKRGRFPGHCVRFETLVTKYLYSSAAVVFTHDA